MDSERPWRFRRSVVQQDEERTNIRRTMGALGWRHKASTEVMGTACIFEKVAMGRVYQVKRHRRNVWRLRVAYGVKTIYTKDRLINVTEWAWVPAPMFETCTGMALWFDRVGIVLLRLEAPPEAQVHGYPF